VDPGMKVDLFEVKGNNGRRSAKMLQRLINLHFSCQKCPNKWKTEEGLVKLYYNPKWVAENNLWLLFFRTVVEKTNCPKC
jgi:hypothetical protein